MSTCPKVFLHATRSCNDGWIVVLSTLALLIAGVVALDAWLHEGATKCAQDPERVLPPNDRGPPTTAVRVTIRREGPSTLKWNRADLPAPQHTSRPPSYDSTFSGALDNAGSPPRSPQPSLDEAGSDLGDVGLSLTTRGTNSGMNRADGHQHPAIFSTNACVIHGNRTQGTAVRHGEQEPRFADPEYQSGDEGYEQTW
ncbi:hypothetical protein DL93DRAFT_2076438 [Clavulina sp. PMI_390]|nr:hypothetical protein DL93DRAFT_2076438 [Clavulina sp. PMI_390]